MSHAPGDRAQVESLGSLLLVAVVVVSAGTFGAYYIASATGGNAGGAAGGSNGGDLTLELSVTTDELDLSHNGGGSVATDGLQVRIENASGEYTYDFSEGRLRGDGDGQFDPGERWRLAWDQEQNTEVTVSLVDSDGQVVFRGTATTESATTERPADLAEGEAVEGKSGGEESGVDSGEDGGEDGAEDGGDNDDAGGPSEPWLDVDGDGQFEEDDGDVTVDLSGGKIPSDQKETAEDATLRIPAGVTVDTGNNALNIDRAERIRIAGTARSDKKIELAADSISLDNGRLDNTEGSQLQLIVDSKTSLTADGAVLTSANTIELRSSEGMSVDDAEINNTAGNKRNLKLDSEAGLTADGSTLTSAGKIDILSKDEMSVQNATVDNSEGNNVDIFVESKSDLNVDNTVFTASGEVTLKSSGETSEQNTEVSENE